MMWEWRRHSRIVEPNPSAARLGSEVIAVSDTIRRALPEPRQALPEFIVAVDVETTGLHSTDRVVSLGAVWFATRNLLEPAFPISFIHLIFDPGRKSHPQAETVHGYSDWVLRHQDPFSTYAMRIRDFLHAGNVVIAHNAAFDLPFINRELTHAGLSPIDRPKFCTMEGYRAADLGGSASLNSVCAQFGLKRQGRTHGALEDAWLAMMVYLWLHDFQHCRPFAELDGLASAFNLRSSPPVPAGPLPRRQHRS
jgi:DNA polymerase-3 subunit epsilon